MKSPPPTISRLIKFNPTTMATRIAPANKPTARIASHIAVLRMSASLSSSTGTTQRRGMRYSNSAAAAASSLALGFTTRARHLGHVTSGICISPTHNRSRHFGQTSVSPTTSPLAFLSHRHRITPAHPPHLPHHLPRQQTGHPQRQNPDRLLAPRYPQFARRVIFIPPHHPPRVIPQHHRIPGHRPQRRHPHQPQRQPQRRGGNHDEKQ